MFEMKHSVQSYYIVLEQRCPVARNIFVTVALSNLEFTSHYLLISFNVLRIRDRQNFSYPEKVIQDTEITIPVFQCLFVS